LVTDYRVSKAVLDWAQKQSYKILCLTFDELIEQDVDFSPYIQWLIQEVQSLGIDEDYIQLNCSKPEINVVTQAYLGTSHYGVNEGGVEGYVDQWLEAPDKDHISVLGEFGTGKTWFTLHYAWRELRKYQVARQKKMKRSRLPLVMPLRDYAKAVDVENVLAHFFFGKHGIRLNNAVFDRLNEMGKLLLIFDGFDEMADRTNKQVMADNFWQLAQVAVPGSKVILTSRKEHFPNDGDVRLMFNGQVMASKEFKLVTPKFEVLELEQFDEGQIRQVLGRRTDAETVELIVGNEVLLDLARRPVMGQLLVTALADLQVDLRAGVEVNVARVYYYAMRRKMEQDIKTERTFTSLADKTYFLCELAGAMYAQETLSLHFSEFPEQLRSMFGLEDRELDYWCYDMAGETLLSRDREGNYKFAHNSLREFFVAYKFAAELGLLHRDFWGLVAGCGISGSTWSETRRRLRSNSSHQEFQGFLAERQERLVETFGQFPLRQSKVVTDLLLAMLDVSVRYRQTNPLLELMQWTRGRSFNTVGYLGGNAGNLLLAKYPYGLEYQDLSRTVLPALNLWGAGLRQVDLTDTDLSQTVVTKGFDQCNVIVVSSDQTWFATGHSGGTIHIWDIRSRRKLPILVGHQSSVTSLTLTEDGHWLFSGSYDKTIKKWDVETGECLFTFVGHQSSVTSLTLSEDGHWLFSGSYETIKKWDVEMGECLSTFVGHQSSVTSVALSSNDRWLFSGSDDKTIKKWNVETGECLSTFVGHQSSVTSVALSSDDRWLFSGSGDKTIKKWNVETGEYLSTFVGHQSWVRSTALSSDGRWLFSGSDDETIKKWDVETGECLSTFLGHRDWVRSVALSGDGRWLFSGSDDKTIKKWNVETGECLFTFVGHQSWVRSTALSGDSCWLFSGSYDKTIKKWNVRTGECLSTFVGHQSWVNSIVLSGDGHWLFSCSYDETIKKWDLIRGECLLTFFGHQSSVRSVALSGDGRWLFSGSDDKTIKKWDVETGKCLSTFLGHQGSVMSVAINGDRRWLFSGSHDKTIKKWDVETGECLSTFLGHQGSVMSVALSDDKCWLFSSSDDETIKKWDVETGECLFTFVGHQSWVRSVALSGDGRWLFSGSHDDTIKKWDVETGECHSTFLGHQGLVRSIALSGDGCWLFSGSYDETIKKWDVETGEFVDTWNNGLYAKAKISGVQGLTAVQRHSLVALGAVEGGKSRPG
jgi:WD40 repeat protein